MKTRRKIYNYEQNDQPNKKRKRTILRKTPTEEEEEEENANNYNEFNKLCVDVITGILLRCPVNTLSMLRCASKSWNDFITNPFFVRAHLERSNENAQILLLEPKYADLPGSQKRTRSVRRTLRFVSLDMGGKGESNELCTVTFPFFSTVCSDWLACAGLVCLSTGFSIYLCNPVMQQLCKLPKCSRSVLGGPDHFGFGYLHSKKEYKVLRFFYPGPRNRFSAYNLLQLRCEVFTIDVVGGLSNRWRQIAETPRCHPCSPGQLVNECMYWLARGPSNQPDRIVSFEFENEKFLAISGPPSLETLSHHMMDLKGMLCLPDMKHFNSSSILDLWILKDKLSCIWVKEHSINLVNFGPKNILRFFRIRNFFRIWNEEIIFINSDMVVFYDLKRKCFRGGKSHSITGLGHDGKSSLPCIGFQIYKKSFFFP